MKGVGGTAARPTVPIGVGKPAASVGVACSGAAAVTGKLLPAGVLKTVPLC